MSFRPVSILRIAVALVAFSGIVYGSDDASSSKTTCPSIPDMSSFSSSSLPNPFEFADGSPVHTSAEFACRQTEISTLLQMFELGTKPPRPSIFNATFTNTTRALTITAGENGKTISFSPTITYPTSGTGPFPAVIAMDGISIPLPSGIAIVTLNVDDIAQQNTAASRGIGKFYTLYGTNATASAMMAWSWAVSLVIDALEILPETNVNVSRLGVSGCSRDGKGALVAGAFDSRIVLTIPQESGSGGTDCWRLSDELQATGIVTQTANEIVQENVWFSTSFESFANTTVSKLPVDHHLLAGLVAPRGLFVIDNLGVDWLGAWSSFGCMTAAHTVWQALGAPDNMGFSQAANHSHCAFPASQQPVLDLFINKFLLDIDTNTTGIQQTAGTYGLIPDVWTPWSTKIPKLT